MRKRRINGPILYKEQINDDDEEEEDNNDDDDDEHHQESAVTFMSMALFI